MSYYKNFTSLCYNQTQLMFNLIHYLTDESKNKYEIHEVFQNFYFGDRIYILCL